MGNHVGAEGTRDTIGTLGDKKSHYTALLVGFSIGAFVSAMVLLAVAMATSAGL